MQDARGHFICQATGCDGTRPFERQPYCPRCWGRLAPRLRADLLAMFDAWDAAGRPRHIWQAPRLWWRGVRVVLRATVALDTP